MSGPASGLSYVKSLPSFLKFLEIVVLIIAIGVVGYFLKQTDLDYKKKEYIELFVGAAAAAGVAAVVFFLLFVAGIHKKIGVIAKLAIAAFVLLSILMVVAASFLAHTVKYYDDNGVCDLLKLFDADGQCKHLIVGVATGFIAAVLFLVDAVIHCRL